MKRHLVVTHTNGDLTALVDAVREVCRAEPAEVHVVVPASNDPRHFWTVDERTARDSAEQMLGRTLSAVRSVCSDVTGEVGDVYVMEAIRDALRGGRFDDVMVATPPTFLSERLHLDLAHRVHRAFGLPVVHLVEHGTRHLAALN